MKASTASRSLTGLAAGALLAAALLGVFALGSLVGLPNVAFGVFEWLVRVLPGRLVIVGLETTLRALEGLGLSIKDTSKTAEEAMALTGLFASAALAGLLFFVLVGPASAALRDARGVVLGGLVGAIVLTPPLPAARYAHLLSGDGFDEVIDLATIQADSRVMLAYAWNGQPLPTEHGFPLRVYVPDVYGMKQPKWITEVVLVADFIPGYWVRRGWDSRAQRRTTSVIDTVATSDLIRRGGQTFVPVDGIADAGARGVSKVEVQVDGGPWKAAQVRQPLSALT